MAKSIRSVAIKLNVVKETQNAYLVNDSQGIEVWVPKSQVLGHESDRMIVAFWIVEAKKLNYSPKWVGWYKNGKFIPTGLTTTITHIPEVKEVVSVEIEKDLLKNE